MTSNISNLDFGAVGGWMVNRSASYRNLDELDAIYLVDDCTDFYLNEDHDWEFRINEFMRDPETYEFTDIPTPVLKKSPKITFTIGQGHVAAVNGIPRVVFTLFSRPLSITFSVTENAPAFRIANKGRIDISNPESFITSTAILTNTASEIDTVELFNQQFELPSTVNLSETATTSSPNTDYEVYDIVGNTFKLRAVSEYIPPAVTKRLSVRITLKNGEVINSWRAVKSGAAYVNRDTPLSIAPSQTVSRATTSATAITLYQSSPQNGVGLTFSLTTPENVVLADASIDPASVRGFLDGGFELKRSGENIWSLGFKDGKYPTLINANTKAPLVDARGNPRALAASYVLRLHLWAANTYQTFDTDMRIGNVDYKAGEPVPLTLQNANKTYTAKSRPTAVNVRVTIVKEPPKVPMLVATSNSITAGTRFIDEVGDLGYGGSNFIPHLKWDIFNSDKPGAYALIMYDTTARAGNGFVHWAVTNIPPETSELDHDTALPAGLTTHYNDSGSTGFTGPASPTMDHTYHIVVYALKAPVSDTSPKDFGNNAKSRNWQTSKANFERHLVKTNIIASYQLTAMYPKTQGPIGEK
jgi:Raf kinase inhibitor-like YbhB/YbcL family protein